MDGGGVLAAHLDGDDDVHGSPSAVDTDDVKAGHLPPPFPLGMGILAVRQVAVRVIYHTVTHHLLVGGAIGIK